MKLLLLPFHWLRKAAPTRALWLGMPLLLYAWTLPDPFLFDDLMLLLKTERYIQGETNSLDLYRFSKSEEAWQEIRDRGSFPWWLQDMEGLDYFRPVTERSFYLDVRLFSRNPIGYRAMNLALFAVALLCIHWLFLKTCDDPHRAGVATFFFGISQTATLPVTWVCNRSDLLVLIGTALAAGAYWAAWRKPRKRFIVLALLAFTFALLSKEVAVALCVVVAAHALLAYRKAASRPATPIPGIIAICLVLVAGCYLAYYSFSRPWVLDPLAGNTGSAWMVSRLPLAFLLNLAVWTTGFPITVLLLAGKPPLYAVACAGGAVAGLVTYYLVKSGRGDRPKVKVFFILWAILFMLPSLGVLAATRTLCVATVGWTYLLAGLVLPSRESQVVLPSPLRHWLFCVNGVVSICCVVGTVLYVRNAELHCRRQMSEMIQDLDPPLRDGDTLIVAQAQVPMETICAGDRLEYLSGSKDVALAYLTIPGIDATIEREDDHTLLMRTDGEPLFGPLHRIVLGAHWRPKTGQTFKMRDFEAEITEVHNDEFVTALRIRFNVPMTSPRLHFYPPEFGATARGSAPCSFSAKPAEHASAEPFGG